MKVNIKLFLTALILLIFVGNNYAQKGIGTNNPEPSSVLDLTSTTKGLLIPRMTTQQRLNLPSPAEGLQVYDIDTHTHWFYNGSIWTESNLWAKSGTNISPALAGDDLLLNTGSTLSIADMTQGSVPFIGASGLVTQNNSNLFWNTANNRLGVGTNSPSSTLDINGNALVRNTVTIHTKETYEEEFFNVKLYWNLLQTEETTHDPNNKKFATITSGTGLEQFFPITRWKTGEGGGDPESYGYVGYFPGKAMDFRINTAGKGIGLILGTQLKDVIHIKKSGRVGFNTDSPQRLVHIAGDMQLNEHFFDENGQPGNPGDLLSSTHTGTEWIDVHSVGTDDQNISGSGLSGTTLTIGIENGTSETVDLSSLQDGTGTDDQTVDKFNLNGNTLELSLEDDGVADNTVDLSSLSTNIFNTNGTLSGNRTLTGGGNSLSFTNLSGFSATTAAGQFQLGPDAKWTDARAAGSQKGIEYAANYSNDFTNRSLVDKEYVDTHHGTLQQAFGASIAADGYVEATSGAAFWEDDGGAFKIEAKVGGYEVALSEDGGSNLFFKSASGGTPAQIKFTDGRAVGNQRGIEYYADYSADFTPRSLVDRQYVDDAVVASSITASNGLTRIGNDIRIGGSLSANTDINAGSHKFSVTGTDGTYINSLLIDRFYNMLRTDDPSGGWGVVSSCNTGAYMQAYDGANEQRIMLHKTAGISVRDDIDHRGLLYIDDYSANYTNRSLVDKQYVDDAIVAAANIYGTNGTLTGDRTLSALDYTLSFVTDDEAKLEISTDEATIEGQLINFNAPSLFWNTNYGSNAAVTYPAGNIATDSVLVINPTTGAITLVNPSSLTHTGTTGSIFFAGTNGKPTENNSQLFWDAANNRLGLGTTTPTHKFQVVGQVRATSMANANGTAGSPAYRFNEDANTGIFRAAADQLGFTTGGNEVFRIDASQNMGIGTTTPDYKLQVNGTIAPETTDQDLGTSTLKWDAHLNDVEAEKVTTNEMTVSDLLVAPKLASAPASPTAGQIYYDTATNKLRCYDGTNWNDLF